MKCNINHIFIPDIFIEKKVKGLVGKDDQEKFDEKEKDEEMEVEVHTPWLQLYPRPDPQLQPPRSPHQGVHPAHEQQYQGSCGSQCSVNTAVRIDNKVIWDAAEM